MACLSVDLRRWTPRAVRNQHGQSFVIKALPAAFFVPGLPLTGRPLEVQLTHYLRAVMPPEVFWREIADRLDQEEGVGSFEEVPVGSGQLAHYRYDDEETARRKYHLNYLVAS